MAFLSLSQLLVDFVCQVFVVFLCNLAMYLSSFLVSVLANKFTCNTHQFMVTESTVGIVRQL